MSTVPKPGEPVSLKRNYLSFPETIAQSFANISPTLTPALSIPLVVANAGAGTWLVYLVSMVGLALVGANIAGFGKRLATPGALYHYVGAGFGPLAGFVSGWAMLAAYLGTAMATLLGVGIFANILGHLIGLSLPEPAWDLLGALMVWYVAYKDIRLSAVSALIMEFTSVTFIVILSAIVLFSHGFHWDGAQFALSGVKPGGLALGMVLTVFSYVGFESAATLGHESRQPFLNIPRSVLTSIAVAGLFFILLAYVEVLGYPGGTAALSTASAPLNAIASRYHVAWFGPLTDLGAMVSLFSCTLASVNAGSRTLFAMGQDRHLSIHLGRAHQVNQTPHVAVTIASMAVLAATWALSQAQPLNAYGYFGTYATYGFILAYILVSLAFPFYLRRESRVKLRHWLIAIIAAIFMTIPLVGSIYPVPAFPYNILPYAFLVYVGAGIWVYRRNRIELRMREEQQAAAGAESLEAMEIDAD